MLHESDAAKGESVRKLCAGIQCTSDQFIANSRDRTAGNRINEAITGLLHYMLSDASSSETSSSIISSNLHSPLALGDQVGQQKDLLVFEAPEKRPSA